MQRHGLSRIDLVVCILLLGLILAFVGPALQGPRRVSHKLSCLSNMKQIALALHAYATNEPNGQLPPLSDNLTVTNVAGQKSHLDIGWPALLLPALDASALL